MGQKRNIKIKKKIDIGINEKYDNAIEKFTKISDPKLAVKLGKLFKNDKFKNMNADTFMSNASETFDFFSKRNRGILKKDEAYISDDDIIKLMTIYPRMLSQHNKEQLKEKEDILENLSTMDQKSINTVFKNSIGYIYSTGNEKLYRTLTFLDNLDVIDEGGNTKNAAEYLLTVLGDKNLQMGTEKIYQRILHIMTKAKTKVIPVKDFNFCFKRNDEEYERRYKMSQIQLDETYILPKTEDRKEYKEQIKKIVEKQATKHEKRKGE